MADLGARVIKIERPGTGEAGRKLAIKDLWVDENSLLFHTINRNKESFTADLKNPEDITIIKKLIAKSDVLIHNFRPDVMGKNGLDYNTVQQINPGMIYAEISGYGKKGPWKNKPGQDLLLQSITGLAYTTGNGTNGPVPFGISIADILAGSQRPHQWLIEFHHRMYGISPDTTRGAVHKITQAGYQLFYVSESGHEYGFVFRADPK